MGNNARLIYDNRDNVRQSEERRRALERVYRTGQYEKPRQDGRSDDIIGPFDPAQDGYTPGDPAGASGSKVAFSELDETTQQLILAGGAVGDGSLSFEFDFNTSSPTDVGDFHLGDIIKNTEVEILEAFDDPAAWVQCGTVLLGGAVILAQAHIRPAKLGGYATQENFWITGDDQFRFMISPGASTQGRGRVLVEFRRA